MYCPECGHKLSSEDFRFCPECGTRLPARSDVTTDDIAGARGILLTNMKSLSLKLGEKEEYLRDMINDYISRKKRHGVSYTLADAGDYRFRSGWRRVRLGPGSTPEEHISILSDICDECAGEGKLPEYLFIIGGSDIVPMPRIRHYLGEGSSDDTIDTDLLYSYPEEGVTSKMLESREIFRRKTILLVGRLPLAEDACISDLETYLERSLECSSGMEMKKAYGQCDPNWKNVSAEVAESLIISGALPDYGGQLPEEIYHRRLMLSPMLHIGNIVQAFDREASLYYFNLHGGEGRQLNCYFGELPHHIGEDTVPVIGPQHIETCRLPNMVVSEACYGAKFIGLRKSESMMLTSLASNAVIFLGSSRIAWGACDSTEGAEELYAADILAKTFIKSVLDGLSAGEASFTARKKVLESHGASDLYAALTVTEFNLFGDPSVSFRNSGKRPRAHEIRLSDDFGDIGVTVTSLTGNRAGDRGLLHDIRQAVDSNIYAIHTSISEQLYSRYGISPRRPSHILKVSGSGMDDEMIYVYDISEARFRIEMAVTSSASGKIKKVYMSK